MDNSLSIIHAFSNQHFADYRSYKLSLFSLRDISSSISKLCYLNVSMFSCQRVKMQLGKKPTVSELDMDKLVLRAK